MKSSKFFVKSNYIKNAKNNWILCECKLLCHQNITFLHIKSINLFRVSDDNISDVGSSVSGFSTLSRMQEYKSISKGKIPCLNVLCNLFEFKSCEIKTVNFECMKKFAIKLVPPGILSNKKLYLLPDLEDCLTEWCDLLTGYITRTINSSAVNSLVDEKSSKKNTLNSKGSIKIDNHYNIANENEIYISLDENDAYEATNQVEYHIVTIEPSDDSMKFHLLGTYLLKLGVDALELMNTATRESIHTFPYSAIRRFGAKDSMFRLEAGRNCSTGHGKFTFQVKDAMQISEKVKENARLNKLKHSASYGPKSLRTPSMSAIVMETETDRDSIVNARSVSMLIDRDTSEELRQKLSLKESDNFPVIEVKLDEELPNEDLSNTVVEEEVLSNVECCGGDLSQSKEDTCERIEDLTEVVVAEETRINEPAVSEPIATSEEHVEEHTIKEEVSSLEIVSIDHMPVVRHRHLDHLDCGSDFGNCKSDTALCRSTEQYPNELRPTSLFERPVDRNAFHILNVPPPIAPETSSSHIISDYKVSPSTFFKYRQRIRNPVLTVPSELPPVATTCDCRQTTDIESPKHSPPPLLPKPKPKSPDVYHDQNGYREFDQMLKDLQLSLS